jgi:subtilisin family serine protease
MRIASRFILLLAPLLVLRGADVPGRIIIGHRQGVDPGLQSRALLLHRAAVRSHLAPLGASVVDVPETGANAILESLEATGLFQYVERDHYAHTAGVPNDPSYGSQWHLPRIQSPQAWTVTTGSAAITVAVVDSGIYGEHPDLASKLVAGWNFVKSNGDTSDMLGHGTAVAGTLAAATNNGVGVSAVNWSSMIMPLVAVDADDYAAYSNIAAAIQYAADHGARVINVSVGGRNSSALLQKAVDYAWSRGAVIFASAMNTGAQDRFYPAACDRVVAISATDTTDRLASFSNYGNWITLSAPGSSILTTMNGGGYGFSYGTSFASPIVAGVAALMLSANPALSPGDVVSLLQQTAEDLGSPGYDSSFGWGRVNAYRAVEAARQRHVLPVPVDRTPHPRPARRW